MEFTAKTIFCEDIRNEASGLVSLMGVMSTTIRAIIPGIIPRSGTHTIVEFDPKALPKSIVFRLDGPWPINGVEPFAVDHAALKKILEPVQDYQSLPSVRISLNGLLLNFSIPTEGFLKAIVSVDGIEQQSGYVRFISAS
jgi:hypothetical protein